MVTDTLEDVAFADLFNDGKIINFTPNDPNKNKLEIQSFKKKLNLYEKENP